MSESGKNITWNDARLTAAIDAAANAGLSALAEVVADTAVRSFGINHGGVPSIPGNPPNSQLGLLYWSIKWVASTNLVSYVGTGVKYGYWLEFGTRRRKPRLDPRPWLRPALARGSRAGLPQFLLAARQAFARRIAA
jgi:hypothetical protein